MVAVLSADAPEHAWRQTALPWESAAVVRAQSPDMYFDGGAPPGSPVMPYSAPGGYAPGAEMPFMAPGQPVDPFMLPPGVVPHAAGPHRGGQFALGPNGYQPFEIGGQGRFDVFYMVKEKTTDPNLTRMGISGLNAELEYTNMTGLGWIFSFTQQAGVRWWDGPGGPVGLPGDVYRLGWDFELSTPKEMCHPWGLNVGFNPSINSSFEHNLSSDAYQWDVRGYATYEVSPELLLAGGAGVWDRVRDRVIPYAGLIWLPDDRWEFRILFPESQISYFLGTHGSVAQWLYVRGEYRVEAYEVMTGVGPARQKDEVEVEDWRILFGYQADGGFFAGFIEAGWVFGRDVAFKHHSQPGFDITSGFIARTGFRF